MEEQQNAVAEVQTQEEQKQPTQAVDPSWLNDRLARARESARKELQELYGADPETVKAAMKLAKELQEAKLSEEEKRAAELAAVKAEAETLKQAAEKAKQYESALKLTVDAKLADLKEEQKQFVLETAGEDPAQQLKLIERLSSFGLMQQKLAQPATTAPVEVAPKATASAQENLVQRYRELKSDPNRSFELAYFIAAHPDVVVKNAQT